MLYSVSGGSISPWADKQMIRFVIGFALMIVVALVGHPLLDEFCLPGLCDFASAAYRGEVAGHVGLGAQRWITLGPLELQPSEPMKIALVLALARYLHGLSVEKFPSRCVGDSAGDDRDARRPGGDTAQSWDPP